MVRGESREPPEGWRMGMKGKRYYFFVWLTEIGCGVPGGFWFPNTILLCGHQKSVEGCQGGLVFQIPFFCAGNRSLAKCQEAWLSKWTVWNTVLFCSHQKSVEGCQGGLAFQILFSCVVNRGRVWEHYASRRLHQAGRRPSPDFWWP
jgi:hypothetical protein